MSALAQRRPGSAALDTRAGACVQATGGGAYLRLSPGAAVLLRKLDAGASFDEIARVARRAGGEAVTAAEVEAACSDLRARIAAADANARRTPSGFWLRVPLLRARVVGRIAAYTQHLLRPTVAAALAGFILIGAALTAHARLWSAPLVTDAFWPGYALLLIALLAHELGHASACRRGGAPPGEIGFVSYLVFPAFYSDVSSAWTLRRGRRVLVDVSGVFFELGVGAAYAVAYAWTGWEPLRTAIVLIAASCVTSLNPILKFDGYWLVADALDVTNLSAQPAVLARHFVARLRGRAVPPLPPWPPWIAALLVAYGVVTVGFFVGFAVTLVPAVARIAAGYPELLVRTFGPIARAEWPRGGDLQATATSTYLLAFAGTLATRILARGARFARRAAARSS